MLRRDLLFRGVFRVPKRVPNTGGSNALLKIESRANRIVIMGVIAHNMSNEGGKTTIVRSSDRFESYYDRLEVEKIKKKPSVCVGNQLCDI